MTTQKNDEDPRAKAVKNNPCGICRALGLPVCKGHGGGSGGGGGDASKSADDTLDTTSNIIDHDSLEKALSNSPLWDESYNIDDLYTFDTPHSLFSIKLDLGSGTLVFSARDNLSKEEQQALKTFFDAVENELNEFKNELKAQGFDTDAIQCHREKNSLSIKLPTPKYYDAFIQRLMDKNLLVTQVSHELNEIPSIPSDAPKTQRETQQASSTAPNPFDISKGPKFED